MIRRRAGVADQEADSAGFVGAVGNHSIAEERGAGGGRRCGLVGGPTGVSGVGRLETASWHGDDEAPPTIV